MDAAVRESDRARALRASSSAPRSNIRRVLASMRRQSSSRGTSSPKTRVGCLVSADQRRSAPARSELPASASSRARTTRRRSFGCRDAAAAASRSASAAWARSAPSRS
jgi:hypothetical protein